jgi:hypothetical protein
VDLGNSTPALFWNGTVTSKSILWRLRLSSYFSRLTIKYLDSSCSQCLQLEELNAISTTQPFTLYDIGEC